MKLCLLEPYDTGSHAQWARGLKKYSQHQIDILSLNGQYWKWRMHGGAVTLARQFMEMNDRPDLILATDMLDLSTFLALTRTVTAHIPTAVYFHENQLVYPWSPTDRDVQHRRDRHYGFINYVTALSADAVFFNSAFHQDEFIGALPRFLKHFPDYRELASIHCIEAKSEVLYLGLDLHALDKFKPAAPMKHARPLILWNHRWEYDKNPNDFFQVLFKLRERGENFDVVILGENFSQKPAIFEEAKSRLGDTVLHYGYVDSFESYAQWLWRADILPVTSNHDFFGASVAEAVYCGCHPLLPRRLTYPELLPGRAFDGCFYTNIDELERKLSSALKKRYHNSSEAALAMARFNWRAMAPVYDAAFEKLGHVPS